MSQLSGSSTPGAVNSAIGLCLFWACPRLRSTSAGSVPFGLPAPPVFPAGLRRWRPLQAPHAGIATRILQNRLGLNDGSYLGFRKAFHNFVVH